MLKLGIIVMEYFAIILLFRVIRRVKLDETQKINFPDVLKIPFQLIKKNKRESVIWFFCILIGGQFGIIITWFMNDTKWVESISKDIGNGNFYIFAIALMASSIYALLINFLDDKESRFKSIKLFTIFFLGIGIFWCGLMHSLVQANADSTNDLFFKKWIFQIWGYLSAILVSIYATCLLKLKFENKEHKKLDDTSYHDKLDQESKEMSERANSMTTGPNGEEL